MIGNPLSGSCACGEIKYTINGQVLTCGHCHCESCRRWQSSAFATWLSCRAEDFRIDSGAEKLGVYESSSGVSRQFCLRCGSPLFYRSIEEADVVYATLSSLTASNGTMPTRHVSFEERVEWFAFVDDLPKFKGKCDLIQVQT